MKNDWQTEKLTKTNTSIIIIIENQHKRKSCVQLRQFGVLVLPIILKWWLVLTFQQTSRSTFGKGLSAEREYSAKVAENY